MRTASFESPPVIPVWSAGNTVLTCTPWPAFANNHTIQWEVCGQDATGNPLTAPRRAALRPLQASAADRARTPSRLFWSAITRITIKPAPVHAVLFPALPMSSLRDAPLLQSHGHQHHGDHPRPVRSYPNLVEDLLHPERFSVGCVRHQILRPSPPISQRAITPSMSALSPQTSR